MFQTKVVQKIKTYLSLRNFFFPKVALCVRRCGKIWYSQTGHGW